MNLGASKQFRREEGGRRSTGDPIVPIESTSSYELKRVSNELKSNQQRLEEALKDNTVLKSTLSTVQRALQQRTEECASLKDRLTKAEGETAATSKDCAILKGDKKKLETQVADLMRQTQKLSDRVEQLSNKSPGFSAQVASMTSEMRSVRNENQKLIDDNKALINMVRNKDRELERAAAEVEEARLVQIRNKELTNLVLELTIKMDKANDDIRTLNGVVRQRDSDLNQMNNDLDNTKMTLANTNATLAATTSMLKASDGRCADLNKEVSVLRDELARTSAVAARAVVFEHKSGPHSEGTIPVTQHIEEVKYLHGEIARMKERMFLTERDLAVSRGLQENYRSMVEAKIGPLAAEPSDSTIAAAIARMSLAGQTGNRVTIQRSASDSKKQTPSIFDDPMYASIEPSYETRMARSASMDDAFAPLPSPAPIKVEVVSEPQASLVPTSYAAEEEPSPVSEEVVPTRSPRVRFASPPSSILTRPAEDNPSSIDSRDQAKASMGIAGLVSSYMAKSSPRAKAWTEEGSSSTDRANAKDVAV